MTMENLDVTDLLTRARNMSGMLRMCEKISFGSDADVIDELTAEVERLQGELSAALKWRDAENKALTVEYGKVQKMQTEIDRLRPHYQSNSLLDHGRRQMLDWFEEILKSNG